MDNLTHTLTGLLVARAGVGRWMPGATAVLLVASNLPDADIVSGWMGGTAGYLDYHRHLTHALVVAPVMGLLAAIAFSWRAGWRLWPAWAVGTLGVLVHIFLDLWNNYGVRLWLPFRPDWMSWDLVMVVDPWILTALLICVLAPLLSSLVGSEIGGKRPQSPGRGWAIAGLCFLALWVGGRALAHQRAVETLKARNYGGLAPLRVAAWPTPWNPRVWSGYVSTEASWVLHRIDLTREFDPEAGDVYFKPEPSAAIAAARRTPEAVSFQGFAQFAVWRVVPVAEPEGAVLVEATDVRFGPPADGRFQLRVVVDPAGKVISSTVSFGDPRRGFGLSR